MISTTALFILYVSPYHFPLWIKSRSWEDRLAVWTTSESELFSSWCFFMNTVSICELSCVIFPNAPSYVPSYISFADPDFTALLPTVGTSGCIKIMYSSVQLVLKRKRSVLFRDVVIEDTVIIMPCLLYECLTLRSENIWTYEGWSEKSASINYEECVAFCNSVRICTITKYPVD